jgi:hypothetical protein
MMVLYALHSYFALEVDSYADFWNKYLDISGWIHFDWYIYIIEMFNLINLQFFEGNRNIALCKFIIVHKNECGWQPIAQSQIIVRWLTTDFQHMMDGKFVLESWIPKSICGVSPWCE